MVIAPMSAQAHTVIQARVVHILVSQRHIECYVNFLLPRNPKSALWIRLFDRNQNGQLEPTEQLALGRFLAHRYLSRIVVHMQGQRHAVALKEVVNSQLRGDARKHSYAWDYRWSVLSPPPPAKRQTLSVSMSLLFAQEVIPVALIPLSGQKLQATATSYILTKRPHQPRAICRIDAKQSTCSFAWQTITSTSQPSSR